MIGAGGAPAGSSLAGYGVISLANVSINAPLPDPTPAVGLGTNFSTTCRLLVPNAANGGRGDWAFTSDGRVVGCGTVRQNVQLALSTILGSACVVNLGLDFSGLQEKGQNFQRQVATAVANALGPIVKQGLVAIRSVDVGDYQSNPDSALAYVRWADLTTGVEDTQAIGP